MTSIPQNEDIVESIEQENEILGNCEGAGLDGTETNHEGNVDHPGTEGSLNSSNNDHLASSGPETESVTESEIEPAGLEDTTLLIQNCTPPDPFAEGAAIHRQSQPIPQTPSVGYSDSRLDPSRHS